MLTLEASDAPEVASSATNKLISMASDDVQDGNGELVEEADGCDVSTLGWTLTWSVERMRIVYRTYGTVRT